MDDDLQGDGDGVTDEELNDLHKRNEERKKKKDNKCDTNNNGVADIPCLGLTTRDWNDGRNRLGSSDICPSTSLIECYYLHGSIYMGDEPMYFTSQEFEDLLLAIYYEVNGRNSADLMVSSMAFDTPFYDQGRLHGLGAIPGTGCVEGLGCFARHELNYIAQGEIAAAAGESRLGGMDRVYAWKLIPGILSFPSDGTLKMWNVGYDFVHKQNGTTPPRDMREYYWINIK